MNWWYAKDGEKKGPVEDAELREMARAGRLGPGDLVWNETFATWMRAETVPGLLEKPQTVVQAGSAYASDGLTPNATLMEYARESLRGWWGPAIGVVVVVNAAMMIMANLSCIGAAANMILGGPLTVGVAAYFLALARRNGPAFGTIMNGFNQFWNTVAAYLLVMLFTMLWTLLLIVPGIIKSYSYSMTFFILVDNPEIGPMEAIDRSMEMMDGRKWKLFCLQWRFFGWILLALLTCGIGLLWVLPYINSSIAHFYDDVKGRAPARQP